MTVAVALGPNQADLADQVANGARLIQGGEIRLSELIAALSVALDITEGQPSGHAMRNALIGMRIARELRLPLADRSALFYALLLKDLGCSSNAAKMTYLFGADDRRIKRESKNIDWAKTTAKIKYVWQQCAPDGSVVEKLLRIAALARSGPQGERRIVQIRCERGADIARRLQFPEATCLAIRALDEHWDGHGQPEGLRGDHIPLLGRICCLAQTVEVFFANHGLQAALEMAHDRRGSWFDPQLVDALLACKNDVSFWMRLHSSDLFTELKRWEPQDAVLMADEDCLDRVAEAFASVVDAKSPWTFQHSARVAEIAVGIARDMQCDEGLVRDVRRAGLLHDIGKLGISNIILDKPSRPTEEEFAEIRKHPDYSLRILQKVGPLAKLADVASGHHERIDGRGYHRQIEGQSLPMVTRMLAVADICEALTAKRPYRDGMTWEQTQRIMAADVGTGIDADCFAALRRWQDRSALASRMELQMQEVDRLIAELG